jgi:putative glutamine amidotransferase
MKPKHIATWIEKDRDKHFDEIFAGTAYHVWNARVSEVPWDEVGGLMLTGGCDISADFLQQPVPDPAVIHEPEVARDKWEFSILHKALGRGLPVFAICRGHQVLNVALGGTLLLDIPGHNLPEQKYGNVQELRYTASAELRLPRVNSSHHQAIAKLGDGLDIEAWHAVDDIIEQVRLRDYPFCLGVQYHPERDPIYRPLFDAFLQQVK